jgi:hypothetical protein
MAGIIATSGQSGLTAYVFIRNESGQIWNGSAFENYNVSNWATYDIAMTEQTSSGFYSASMPVLSLGRYLITIHGQLGGSPAAGDDVIGQGSILWDGTNVFNEVSLTSQQKTDVLTQIQNALDTAIPGSPTSNSINERIKAIDDKLPSGTISDFDESSNNVNLNASQSGVTIGTVNSLGSTAQSQVNAEVVDALFTDLISELTVGAPSATPTIAKALMALYMTWRNATTQSTTEMKVRNNSGSVVFKAATTDSGSEFTKGQYVTGP